MKGLLLKDFYMAAKYCRTYLIITIVFAFCSIWGDNLFLMFYPVMMAGIISVNLISYDEKSKWNVYAGTFPYTQKELVSVKYVVTLIFLGVGSLFIAVAQAASMFMFGNNNWKSYGMLITMLPTLGLVSPCVLLPVVFKFGVEKGRVIFYAVIIVMGGVFGALGALGINMNKEHVLFSFGMWFIPATIVFDIVILSISWLISIRFYQKREM